jgi:hypothetical protein
MTAGLAAPFAAEPKRQRPKTTTADALALWARAQPIAGTHGGPLDPARAPAPQA